MVVVSESEDLKKSNPSENLSFRCTAGSAGRNFEEPEKKKGTTFRFMLPGVTVGEEHP